MGAEVHTGAMIALLPTVEDAERLAIKGGEEPDQLHITSSYLGKAADIPEEQQRKLIAAMGVIAGKWPQCEARVFSVNMLNPDGNEPCVVLGLSGKEISDLHDAMFTAMRDAGTELPPDAHHPWIPHMTLIYTDDPIRYVEDIAESSMGAVTIDRLRLAFAGVDTDIALTGTQESYKEYMAAIETKAIRRVRTASGAARYGQPIGSIIVRDGANPLRNLQVGSNNREVRDRRGGRYSIHQLNGRWQARDQSNNSVAIGSSEEELLERLDSHVGGSNGSGGGSGGNTGGSGGGGQGGVPPGSNPNPPLGQGGGPNNSIPPRAIRRRLAQANAQQLQQMRQAAQQRANAGGPAAPFWQQILQMIIDAISGQNRAPVVRSLNSEVEEKVVRRVRTAAGVRKYKQPIGSIIVRDGVRLRNLTVVDSPYDNFSRVRDRRGRVYDVGYDEETDRYVATGTDSWDAVAEGASEEEVLEALDNVADLPRRTPERAAREGAQPRNRRQAGGRESLTQVESDYDGYQAYEGTDGTTYHVGRADDDGQYYATGPGEWDDIVAGPVRTRREALDLLNAHVSRRTTTPEGTGRTPQEAARNLTGGNRELSEADLTEAERRFRGAIMADLDAGRATPAESARQLREFAQSVRVGTRGRADRRERSAAYLEGLADEVSARQPAPRSRPTPSRSDREAAVDRLGRQSRNNAARRNDADVTGAQLELNASAMGGRPRSEVQDVIEEVHAGTMTPKGGARQLRKLAARVRSEELRKDIAKVAAHLDPPADSNKARTNAIRGRIDVLQAHVDTNPDDHRVKAEMQEARRLLNLEDYDRAEQALDRAEDRLANPVRTHEEQIREVLGNYTLTDITDVINRTGLSREDVHAALLRMRRSGTIDLQPQVNRHRLTDEDEDNRLVIGGEPRHVVQQMRNGVPVGEGRPARGSDARNQVTPRRGRGQTNASAQGSQHASGRLGTTTDARGNRTTRVTMPDGTVAERTSRTRDYEWAVMTRSDNHAYAQELRSSAENRRRAIAEARRRLAENDYTGLERRNQGGSYNSGATYDGFIPGSDLRFASWGNDRGAAAPARNIGPEPLTGEYDAEYYIRHHEQLADREERQATELAAGPQYSYGIAQWSSRRDLASRAAQTAGQRHVSARAVPVDGSPDSERRLASGRTIGFEDDDDAGEGYGRRSTTETAATARERATTAPSAPLQPERRELSNRPHFTAPLSMDIMGDSSGRIYFDNTSYANESGDNSIPIRREGNRWIASELPDGDAEVSAGNPRELMERVARRLNVTGTVSIEDEREGARTRYTGQFDVQPSSAAARTRQTQTGDRTPGQVIAELRAVRSEEEGAAALEGLSKAELRQLAREANITVGSSDSVDKIRRSILQYTVRRRLNSETIARPNLQGGSSPAYRNTEGTRSAEYQRRIDRLKRQARTSATAWALLPEADRAGIPFPGNQRSLWVHRRQTKAMHQLLHELKAITPGGRVGDPSSRNLSPRENWVDKAGGMPRYMRFVRNMFLRKGYSMGHATAAAVNAIKKWARGGGNVTPKVQAAAAAALAQWEKMKAA